MSATKILIIGVSGMLGHVLFSKLSEDSSLEVHGTARSRKMLQNCFAPALMDKIRQDVNAEDVESIERALADVRPDIVINCVGIVKQLPIAKDPIISISINSLFPHQLAKACKTADARLIHFSTDCVFSGNKGNYTEQDPSDADDLYGRTKYLGEVSDPHCLTLRTSIIGHELKGAHGLVDWFLSQTSNVKGFTKAIYTGFPTVEIARILKNYVFHRTDLSGLYHVSSDPISKYDLLRLIALRYEKTVEIEPYAGFVCDRSLDSTHFRAKTGYIPPSWQELIKEMRTDYQEHHKPAIQ